MDYIWMALIGGAAAFPHCMGIMAAMGTHGRTTEMLSTCGVGKSPDLAASSAGCANSTEVVR